jgi:hypothetical protein
MKDHVEGCKLADDFTSLCKNAVGYMKAMEEYNPALMNAVRQYLKDNNVTVDNRTGTPMNELANEFDKMLPFPDEETQQKQKQL